MERPYLAIRQVTWQNCRGLSIAPHDGNPVGLRCSPTLQSSSAPTIKVLFKLPLRQTTRMLACLLKMAGLDWTVRDYTTLCRRQKTLAIPYRRADCPLNLLIPRSFFLRVLRLAQARIRHFAGSTPPGKRGRSVGLHHPCGGMLLSRGRDHRG